MISAGIYLLKVNNRNTRTRCEICSKLTIKTPERHQWCRSGVFVVNFEHISHLVQGFHVDFEQVNARWDSPNLALTFLLKGVIDRAGSTGGSAENLRLLESTKKSLIIYPILIMFPKT